MKSTKCPAKDKKWGKKSKRRGQRENEKKKLRLLRRFQTQNYLKTLLSSYTHTSQANILHLDQKQQSAWSENGFVESFSSL